MLTFLRRPGGTTPSISRQERHQDLPGGTGADRVGGISSMGQDDLPGETGVAEPCQEGGGGTDGEGNLEEHQGQELVTGDGAVTAVSI